MQNKQGVVLTVSLFLNAVFVLAIIWLWVGGKGQETAHPTPPAVAQVTATPTEQPTATPQPTAVPTVEPSPTPPPPTLTPTPTATATAEPEPTPTETPLPDPTALPATPEITLIGPPWLRYLNQFRLQAGLPLLAENSDWSHGGAAHSRYMALHDIATHSQDPSHAGYSQEGALAAANGNIAMSGSADVSLVWPIDYWMSTAFHALPMLDPQLQRVGYGDYRDPYSPAGLTATLDVKRGLAGLPEGLEYPITFPKAGGQLWVTSLRMPEFPDTVAGCPGYSRITGAPIFVQIGPGDRIPFVTRTELLKDGRPVDHCFFDETTYRNNNPYWQTIGQQILNERDAIVILPRLPFEIGSNYRATVEANGQTITWEFAIVPPPRLD
jgi:uncharacterized protein YkwD